MSKKDRKEKESREARGFDPAKIKPEIRAYVEEHFPKSIADALLSGCDEYDFMNALEYILIGIDRGLQRMIGRTMMEMLEAGLPPVLPREVSNAQRSVGAALVRFRELFIHVLDCNKAMKDLEDAQAVAKNKSGIIVATEEAAKSALGVNSLTET